MTSLEERIDELETKVSYLELANQQMSDLMYRQQQEIEAHMQRLAAKLERLDHDAAPMSLKDEIPPHY